MLKITVSAMEFWDDGTSRFVKIPAQTLKLEHSLISIYKWESKWHKSFLSTKEKTAEEALDYIRCMTINQEIDPIIYRYLSVDQMTKIKEYVSNSMTATTVNNRNKRPSRQIITAEVIYSWMIDLGIPLEFEKRHLNHLLTLIDVCSIRQSPGKKMSKKDIYNQNRALNASRKARIGTHG